MRTKLLIILIFNWLICLAQNNYAHLEGSFLSEKATSVPENLIKTDLNEDTLSVIVIKSKINDLIFRGNVFGQVEKTFIPGEDLNEYHVFITEGTRRLTVKHNSYHEAEIIFPAPVKQKELLTVSIVGIDAPAYELVEIDEEDYTYPINIEIEPWATLLVDEEVSLGGNMRLEEGSHYITSKYLNNKYSQKINVNKPNMEVDANIGGTLTIKSASRMPDITSDDDSPIPQLIKHEGHTYVFGNMLGQYNIKGRSTGIGLLAPKSISKDSVNISSRSNITLRFDEMVGYSFLLYHGSTNQPVGFNVGYCKNFGLFASYTCDLKSSIETSYGKTEFIEGSGDEATVTRKSTSMTIHIGPMFRLYRKLYAQVGAGTAIYLRTNEPKILTPDYKYVVGGSVGVSLFYRINWIMFGGGYVHQFVKGAFNPNIANQFTFTAGVAF